MSSQPPEAFVYRPARRPNLGGRVSDVPTWLALPLLTLAGLAAGYLAAHDARVGLLLGGSLVGLVYLTSAPRLEVATAAFLVLLLLPRSFMSTSDLSDDLLRTVAVLLLVPFALPQTLVHPAPPAVTTELHGLEPFVMGYVIYMSASTLLHGQAATFLIHALATLLLVIAIRALTVDGGEAVARACPWVFGTLVAVSLGMGLLMPGVAFRGDRLRAFMANPNSLGAYAAFAVLVAVVLVRNAATSVLLTVASFAVIWWSGSRASALAAVGGLVILALSGRSRPRWLLAGAATAAITLVVLADVTLLEGALFREANTRDASWGEALRVAGDAPLLGVGAAGETVEVASSPLRAFVHGGAVGLMGVVLMYAALIAAAFRVRGPLAALTVTGIVHSLAEGWFLSAVSPMLLVYLAVWIAFLHESGVRAGARSPTGVGHVD